MSSNLFANRKKSVVVKSLIDFEFHNFYMFQFTLRWHYFSQIERVQKIGSMNACQPHFILTKTTGRGKDRVFIFECGEITHFTKIFLE